MGLPAGSCRLFALVEFAHPEHVELCRCISGRLAFCFSNAASAAGSVSAGELKPELRLFVHQRRWLGAALGVCARQAARWCIGRRDPIADWPIQTKLLADRAQGVCGGERSAAYRRCRRLIQRTKRPAWELPRRR
jgi:hypothetical protein